jgi:hypothetical protein
MNSTDPSLDARIWAYVRGEGSHAERKKLESEVSSSPVAARRYAALKLLHQREMAHREAKSEGLRTSHSRATHKAASGNEHSTPAPAKSAGKLDGVILALALVLTIVSLGLYVARGSWPPPTLLAVRDGLHLGAALLAIAMALLRRHSRVWIVALSVGGIAVTCGIAAMLVR